MIKNKLKQYDLYLYEETLENGLRVFIVPKVDVNGIYVTFSTKFGSINDEFVPINETKIKKFPRGIAHFLEHKVFEQKDGKTPFEFYSERGCDSNANTSNYKTTYLFSGSNSFKENLEYLLDYVQTPYFTDQNVEKEKGIIEQEIKMYDDDPYFRIYDGILNNSFITHPIKYPISGKVEDIKKITKDDLYTCYNTFYNPSNMFLVITGNVDPIETIETIKNNQSKKDYKKIGKIKLKKYNEENKVCKEKYIDKMDIEIPKVAIGYKIDCSKINKNIYDIKSYLSILFDLKLGSTSKLNEVLKEKNLITSDVDFSLVNTDTHILIIVIFESNSSEEVLKSIEKELSKLDIEENELERKKKVKKSNCIYRSDDIYAINSKIMNNIINFDKVILDDYKKIDELNIKELKNIIKNINLNNKSIYYLNKS